MKLLRIEQITVLYICTYSFKRKKIYLVLEEKKGSWFTSGKKSGFVLN